MAFSESLDFCQTDHVFDMFTLARDKGFELVPIVFFFSRKYFIYIIACPSIHALKATNFQKCGHVCHLKLNQSTLLLKRHFISTKNRALRRDGPFRFSVITANRPWSKTNIFKNRLFFLNYFFLIRYQQLPAYFSTTPTHGYTYPHAKF